MKALFLDIDGVANSTRSVFAKIGPASHSAAVMQLHEYAFNGIPYGALHALSCVDPVCVGLVNRLLVESGADLVLSSTHRTYFSDEHTLYGSGAHLATLRLYLKAMGFFVPEVFSITKKLIGIRGYEVQAWIDAHEPDRYVILDDGTDFLPGQPLVLCDADMGLDFKNYAEACKFLGTTVPGMILT